MLPVPEASPRYTQGMTHTQGGIMKSTKLTGAALAAGLTAFLLARPMAAAAVGGCGGSASGTQATIAAIEAKFGLRAEVQGSRCGGDLITFHYDPSMNIVPASSYFARWNSDFPLGTINGSPQEIASDLAAILALTPAQMEQVKLANMAYMRDSYSLGNLLGLRTYDPNALPRSERITSQGMLAYFTVPHCQANGFSNSGENIGEAYLPIFELAGVGQLGHAPLYRSGDLRRALLSGSSLLANYRRIAADNARAFALAPDARTRESLGLTCDGFERDSVVDWETAAELR